MLIHYGYNMDRTIKRFTMYNDLGILFDFKFTFIEHINDVVSHTAFYTIVATLITHKS